MGERGRQLRIHTPEVQSNKAEQAAARTRPRHQPECCVLAHDDGEGGRLGGGEVTARRRSVWDVRFTSPSGWQTSSPSECNTRTEDRGPETACTRRLSTLSASRPGLDVCIVQHHVCNR